MNHLRRLRVALGPGFVVRVDDQGTTRVGLVVDRYQPSERVDPVAACLELPDQGICTVEVRQVGHPTVYVDGWDAVPGLLKNAAGTGEW